MAFPELVDDALDFPNHKIHRMSGSGFRISRRGRGERRCEDCYVLYVNVRCLVVLDNPTGDKTAGGAMPLETRVCWRSRSHHAHGRIIGPVLRWHGRCRESTVTQYSSKCSLIDRSVKVE